MKDDDFEKLTTGIRQAGSIHRGEAQPSSLTAPEAAVARASAITLNSPHAARVLYRTFLGGVLTICAVFLVIVLGLQIAPMTVPGDTTLQVAYLLAACAAGPLALALFVLKPRVPMRRSGEDEVAYWQAALGPAISVWVVVASAGIIGAVGALLTGSLVPTLAAAVALGYLIEYRPSYFANN